MEREMLHKIKRILWQIINDFKYIGEKKKNG